jgi:WD40 repeat protein
VGSSLDLLRSWLLRSGRVTGESLALLEREGPLAETALRRGLLSPLEATWLDRLPPDWSGDLTPKALGEYLIEQELGRGGMGVVYRAFDARLERRVAIKVLALKEEHGSQAEAAKERFAREARATATLAHPNLVQVYGVGVEGERPYLAMEYVEGGDLEARLRLQGEARPSFRQLVTWTAQVAAGLGAAHAAGIIHRDVKPANVLIDLEGQARLTDFGLAKRLDDDVHLTRSSALLGTPIFMSPEQAGRKKELGPETDVFSLGGVLYYGLTGSFPFGSESLTEILVAVTSEDPTPPRELQPRIPLDLENVVLRCLEKDPAARYPDGAALAQELQHFLLGEAVTARALTRGQRLRRWTRRNPALATLGALSGVVVAGLLLALAAGGWWSSVQIKDSLAQEQARAEEARQARAAAEAALAKAEAARTREAEARTDEALANKRVRRLLATQGESFARALRDRGVGLLQSKAHNEAAALLASSLAKREDPVARGAFMSAWRHARRLTAFEPAPTPASALPSGGAEGFLLALRTGFLSRPGDPRSLSSEPRGVAPVAFVPFGESELLFERRGRVLVLPFQTEGETVEATMHQLPLETLLLTAVPRGRERVALIESGGRVSLLEDPTGGPVVRAQLAPLTCAWGRPELPTLLGGREGRIWIWPQGQDPRLLARLETPVLALAYGGPRRLASLGADGVVRLWDEAGAALGTIPTQRRALCLDWGQGDHLLLGTHEGVVEVWNTDPQPTLTTDAWDLVEPIRALAARGMSALAVGSGTYATTKDFVQQASIQATLRSAPQRVTLDASGRLLLTGSERSFARWEVTEGELVPLSIRRGEVLSVAKAHPERGWLVGTQGGRFGHVLPSGPIKLAPLDLGSPISFVGVSKGEVVGISAGGAVGWVRGKTLERKRIPLFAQLRLREALLEGTFEHGTLFASTGGSTKAVGLGSRPGRGSVDGGVPLARWQRTGKEELTTLVSLREHLLAWEVGVGLQSVYTAPGRLLQLDPAPGQLLIRHAAGLDLIGNGYQPLHRWVAESSQLRSATGTRDRVIALYGGRLACFEADRRTSKAAARIRTGGGESFGTVSPSGLVARLEGTHLSACRLGSQKLVSTQVVPSASTHVRRLRLSPSGRHALVVGRDGAHVSDLVKREAGVNKVINCQGRYALEDGAWIGPQVFVLTGWVLQGPEQGRLVQLRVDLSQKKGAQTHVLPMGSGRSLTEPGQGRRRARTGACAGRAGTLAIVHDELIVIQNLDQITGPISAQDARESLSLQWIPLPKITNPVALALDPAGEVLALAAENPSGTHSIWITELPRGKPVGTGPGATLPLGPSLWQGRFEVRELVISPDRRWLLATGDGFLAFDLRTRTLRAHVNDTGDFQAAFKSPSELAYLEGGKVTGTWDLEAEGLTGPGSQLVEQVAKTTGLRVAGGEVILEPDPLEAYLYVLRGR